ncbi:DUF937 domain-containing protein [Stieleria varia]|uniref:EF-hand domain-containing protein n=1 Tax=Stieleria varia TaxID=2528005 RepID=A0A5C6AYP6_9BACT|nr:DUF937 domain-containing protein [Stieleria varia]TWU05103.1 hypothetical protein Pla52n_31490 [Stieleria varia]
MSELLDIVGQHLDQDAIAALSQSLGADPDQTEKAIGAALPTLLGALTRNAENEQGQQRLHHALVRDHDGSLLDQLGDWFAPGQAPAGVNEKATQGNAILDHILGNRKERVEEGVSRASGLTGGQTMKLMVMLAPLLMGALGKRTRDKELSPGGLGDLLNSERKEVESKTFGGGFIARMFDQDGDGDFDMMDIMKFGMSRFFGRKS